MNAHTKENCESQRVIDAYQSGVIELGDLKERRARITEECRGLDERLISLKQQQQEQASFGLTMRSLSSSTASRRPASRLTVTF